MAQKKVLVERDTSIMDRAPNLYLTGALSEEYVGDDILDESRDRSDKTPKWEPGKQYVTREMLGPPAKPAPAKKTTAKPAAKKAAAKKTTTKKSTAKK